MRLVKYYGEKNGFHSFEVEYRRWWWPWKKVQRKVVTDYGGWFYCPNTGKELNWLPGPIDMGLTRIYKYMKIRGFNIEAGELDSETKINRIIDKDLKFQAVQLKEQLNKLWDGIDIKDPYRASTYWKINYGELKMIKDLLEKIEGPKETPSKASKKQDPRDSSMWAG